MGVRRQGEQNIRTVQQNTTGSYTISLPIEVMRELRWKRGQKVVVELNGKTVTVKDWKK